MVEVITNEKLRNFVHASVKTEFGLSVDQVAEKCKTYGRFSAWLNGDIARIKEVLNKVKSNGVSPAFFASYEKTEGYNSSWGWLNHTSVNGTPLTDSDSVSKWVATQSKNMSDSPAWIDFANYKDFVPASIKTAGNADFKKMSSGSIGRVVIAGTAAATWEVYYPNGLKKEYNGVQNYGAPITGMMDTIIAWGGSITGGSGEKPCYPVKAGTPITSSFGMRTHPITGEQKMHNGTDFGGALNDLIYATQSATVYYAGFDDSRGNCVILKHTGDNYYSTYMHMNSLSVSTGQTVAKCSQIGKMGTTGSSTGVHLHFAISTEPMTGYSDGEIYLSTSQGGGDGVEPDKTKPYIDFITSDKYEKAGTLNNMTYYEVKNGDNLSTIANKHGVNMNDIKSVSFYNIPNKNLISIGQVLLLPKGKFTESNKPLPTPARKYKIKSGDSLSAIAVKYKTSVSQLQKMNGITNPDYIRIGQVIFV